MQSVSSIFTTRTQGSLRSISWACLISFLKQYDTGIAFFSIGDSIIGGTDIVKGENTEIQEWDKYNYGNYSNRIIDFEYSREMDKALGGAIMGMADINLANFDNYFTPKQGSEISNYVLPRRPFKLFGGFRNENIPLFIGMTDKMPNISRSSNVAQFHCVDFLQLIFDLPLREAVMYEDYRTDQIISELLQDHAGLTTNQFNLDTGFNIVKFFYANKGDKLGDILRKLVQAELGSIYMDENGVIRFINRINWNSNTQVWIFDESQIIDVEIPRQDDIINVVEVRSNVRDVMAKQKVWELFEPIAVPANGSVTIWADFEDPTTAIDTPAYVSLATTSWYSTNYQSDGSGQAGNANISLDNTYLFSTSYKMVFSNSSASEIFITGIDLFGTPAKIASEIYVREEDTDSITEYEQQILTIENDFIQDEITATSLAKIVLIDNNEYGDIINVEVKGVPQLQIGDMVRLQVDNVDDTFYVQKIVGNMDKDGFIQKLTLVKKSFESYFTVGVSGIGETDKIAP